MSSNKECEREGLISRSDEDVGIAICWIVEIGRRCQV